MKNTLLKMVVLLLPVLFIISCDNDDTPIKPSFDKNIHAERFKGLELGNSKFVLPQSNVDIHIEFDYKAKSKVTKIFFDVIPYKISKVKEGQVAWTLKKYLVPEERYKGELNPHIHYHVYFDEKSKHKPALRPAEGIYKFKITVEHEDGSKSAITKEMHIIQKFKNMKIGNNKTLAFGKTKLDTEFEYVSGSNTVKEIKYQVWFKEWRSGQKREGKEVKIGGWNNVTTILPKELYFGKKNPKIKYTLDMLEGSPKGKYWLNIYSQENGESEAVKLSIPLEIK